MIDGNTKLSDLLMAEEDSNSLMHYGVKGMKWGVRKEAIKEVQEGVRTVDNSLSAVNNIKGHPTYPVKYDNLSDEELNARVNRLVKEHQYSDLKGDTKYVKTGSEKTREILQTIGAALGIASTAAGIIYLYKKGKTPIPSGVPAIK